jgi:hypothetical protein
VNEYIDIQEFSPFMRYGRRSKVELLWRLGVLGEWENYSIQPWERQFWSSSPEAGLHRHVGWVARLFSGRQEQEMNRRRRNRNRMIGIRRLIDSLDQQILRRRGFNPNNLLRAAANGSGWQNQLIDFNSTAKIRDISLFEESIEMNATQICSLLASFGTFNTTDLRQSALLWARKRLANRLYIFHRPPTPINKPLHLSDDWQVIRDRIDRDAEIMCLSLLLDDPIQFSISAARMKSRRSIITSKDSMQLFNQAVRIAQQNGIKFLQFIDT